MGMYNHASQQTQIPGAVLSLPAVQEQSEQALQEDEDVSMLDVDEFCIPTSEQVQDIYTDPSQVQLAPSPLVQEPPPPLPPQLRSTYRFPINELFDNDSLSPSPSQKLQSIQGRSTYKCPSDSESGEEVWTPNRFPRPGMRTLRRPYGAFYDFPLTSASPTDRYAFRGSAAASQKLKEAAKDLPFEGAGYRAVDFDSLGNLPGRRRVLEESVSSDQDQQPSSAVTQDIGDENQEIWRSSLPEYSSTYASSANSWYTDIRNADMNWLSRDTLTVDNVKKEVEQEQRDPKTKGGTLDMDKNLHEELEEQQEMSENPATQVTKTDIQNNPIKQHHPIPTLVFSIFDKVPTKVYNLVPTSIFSSLHNQAPDSTFSPLPPPPTSTLILTPPRPSSLRKHNTPAKYRPLSLSSKNRLLEGRWSEEKWRANPVPPTRYPQPRDWQPEPVPFQKGIKISSEALKCMGRDLGRRAKRG